VELSSRACWRTEGGLSEERRRMGAGEEAKGKRKGGEGGELDRPAEREGVVPV